MSSIRPTTPQLEIAPSFRPRRIEHVIFDWDGTVSLVRGGWMRVMCDVYLDFLPPLPDETLEAREAAAFEAIEGLNGKPNIHQMERLSEWVRERGGAARPAEDYQAEYERRLAMLICRRLNQIQSGQQSADAFMVPGVRELIRLLHANGVQLYLATGTPRTDVESELVTLGLEAEFAGRLFAPRHGGDREFSKRNAIERILYQAGCPGKQVLALGDGPVEIVEMKRAGGISFGVACNEDSPQSGQFDPQKLRLLRSVGADAIMADFREPHHWLTMLLPT